MLSWGSLPLFSPCSVRRVDTLSTRSQEPGRPTLNMTILVFLRGDVNKGDVTDFLAGIVVESHPHVTTPWF
jgi:hypothetical protein